jgi:hypothetical protein
MSHGLRWDKVRSEAQLRKPPNPKPSNLKGATEKQMKFLRGLREEFGERPPERNMSRSRASKEIDRLVTRRDRRNRILRDELDGGLDRALEGK